MRFSLASLPIVLMATSAFAQSLEFRSPELFRNARHDPSGIWSDADMTAFGPNDRGATITEYRSSAGDGSTWIVSQIKNAECSAQLCPTRLVRETPNGDRTIVVDDLMQVGGRFSLNGATLSDGSSSFRVEPVRK